MSPAFSILRQELDSMVRVIFLLFTENLDERRRFIQSTLRGERWQIPTARGKLRNITDREMVEISQELQGWTQSVYKFGCAFVHLSDFHNHLVENPFEKISESERRSILTHMRHYHGGPAHDNPDMNEISMYIPMVFEKISSNLECCVRQLENGETKNI